MLRLARAVVDRPLLLNPFKRRAPARDGFPVFGGAFPVVGHMPAMASDYLGLLRRAERELGPLFWLDVGFGNSTLHALGPGSFGLFKNKVTTSTYLQEAFYDAFGISVIAQDGPVHHHMRSAMNAPFLPRGLSASELGAAFAEMIERRVTSWPARGELRILSETRELVLSLMFRMLNVPDADMSEWRHQYEEFTLLLLNLPMDWPGMPLRRGRRARAWLREQLLGFIRAARARPDAPGLLGMLVHAVDENGESLSDDELIDNLRLLVLAGHETSASTMAWMVAKLAEHPHAWKKLVDEAVSAGGLPRTPKELKSFPWAEAVFRETLRLYPPVSTDGRRAVVDFELDGQTVRAGTMLSIPIIYLSRQASQYERPTSSCPSAGSVAPSR